MRRTAAIYGILVLFATSIVFLVFRTRSDNLAGFWARLKGENSKTSISPTPTISIKDVSSEIIESQNELADLYLQLDLEPEERIALFYDLMSPLGAFDPFARDLESAPAKEISNFLFGYYGKKFGIDEKDIIGYGQRNY